jgi:hypothetical protein
LKKSRLSPVDKIFKFYEWMANEVLFNAVASVFATQYLSPNPPSRKMIKNINSHGVSILNGIKNSAWDMTYLTYWGKSVKRNSCLNLLCSKDKGMIKIAKHLFSDESIPQEDSLTKLIGSCWGKYTRGIVEKYFDVLNCVNKDGDRDVQLPARFSMFPEMTKTLETELIAGK